MQDEIENTATDPTETDADPAAPSVEPSHGIAPAHTQLESNANEADEADEGQIEGLPPTDADTPSEEDANGDETDEGQQESAENDEIEELADESN